MEPKHLEALIAVEKTYWWHVAKRELVLDLLKCHAPPPGILVEGGVGGGTNALTFRERGYEVQGFDLMSESVEHCRKLNFGAVQAWDLQEAWPTETGAARAVVLLDVIEHVPDPARVLRNAASALRPDGSIIVTVPAIPALMGPWDRMLGHYRRYSRRMLAEHARAAGLQISWMSHWNAFTLPAAVAVRAAEKLTGSRHSAEFPPVSRTVNALLIRMARAERRLMARLPIATGLSLVGVLTHERRTEGPSVRPARSPRFGRAPGVQRGAGAPAARA